MKFLKIIFLLIVVYFNNFEFLNILFQKSFQQDAFTISEYKWHLNARNAINNSKRKDA